MAKEIKVYIENSVIGGYFDKEFAEPTQKLFELFRKNVYKPIISSHVIAELNNGAPEHVKENLKTLHYAEVQVNDEMRVLTEKYMAENIVSNNYYDDALHIAIATVLGVDVLVSWNFKHIVNLNKIRLFNAVNLKERYNVLEIRTPQEVLENDN
ncbi:putative PIN domain protein [Candidatus Termititenax persephonae]|uniref:PIN domain protein n=1 Tax=Candidatus Termititenax persephonae TaxID=2218525 RepID=A0A388TGL5_9BACT|nr:putative PIN domain protein [Candidatus Termititenax persephonae]